MEKIYNIIHVNIININVFRLLNFLMWIPYSWYTRYVNNDNRNMLFLWYPYYLRKWRGGEGGAYLLVSCYICSRGKQQHLIGKKLKSQNWVNVDNFLVNGIIPKKIPNLVKWSIPNFSSSWEFEFTKVFPTWWVILYQENTKLKGQIPRSKSWKEKNVGNFSVDSIIPKKIPNSTFFNHLSTITY